MKQSLRSGGLLLAGALIAYTAPAAQALEGEVLTTVPACRIASTVTSHSRFVAGETRSFNVVGASTNYSSQGGSSTGCGIPGFASGVPQVTAIVANLTAVNPGGAGNFRVFPGNVTTTPLLHTMNFSSIGLNLLEQVVIPVRQDVQGGDIKVFTSTASDLLIEVTGYFSDLGQQTVAGPSGATGPSGPSGPSGPTGPSGATGLSGPTGATGSPGIDGTTGPSGPSGPEGPTGVDGLPGPSGPSGPSGPTGPQGAGPGLGIFSGRVGALPNTGTAFGAPVGDSTSGTLGSVATLNSNTPCTARNLAAKLNVAPGGVKSRTASLVVNGVKSTNVSCVIVGAATSCTASGTEAVAAGATLAMEIDSSSGKVGGTTLQFGFECAQ